MVADSSERELLEVQLEQGWSLFACAATDIFSSRAIDLGQGFRTIEVLTDFKCKIGGDFNTALNTDIFLAIWDKVFERRRFKAHAWTVKADADTVFLPHRLRGLLSYMHEQPEGTYINNCRYGLHGPLEVLSRNAVHSLQRGVQGCRAWLTGLCSGPCPFGEDMWLDKCLGQHLKANRISAFNVLSEDHCDSSEEWRTCGSKAKAAFHPFKTAGEFSTCMHQALSNDGFMVK